MNAEKDGHGRKRDAHAEDVEFARELERRLETIEASGYEDPARRDLPTIDLVLFTIASVAVIVLVHLWGF